MKTLCLLSVLLLLAITGTAQSDRYQVKLADIATFLKNDSSLVTIYPIKQSPEGRSRIVDVNDVKYTFVFPASNPKEIRVLDSSEQLKVTMDLKNDQMIFQDGTLLTFRDKGRERSYMKGNAEVIRVTRFKKNGNRYVQIAQFDHNFADSNLLKLVAYERAASEVKPDYTVAIVCGVITGLLSTLAGMQ